jgi:8-oxo-dGTP pyrophosphatase MutT (NUDIX family)
MAALKTTSRRSTTSAGILAYRKGARGLEVLLVHPGGPFWRKKDDGAWSIPKGEIDAGEVQSRPRDVSLPRNSAAAPRLVGCRP